MNKKDIRKENIGSLSTSIMKNETKQQKKTQSRLVKRNYTSTQYLDSRAREDTLVRDKGLTVEPQGAHKLLSTCLVYTVWSTNTQNQTLRDKVWGSTIRYIVTSWASNWKIQCWMKPKNILKSTLPKEHLTKNLRQVRWKFCVNLKQSRVIWKEGTSIEKMRPKDTNIEHFLNK